MEIDKNKNRKLLSSIGDLKEKLVSKGFFLPKLIPNIVFLCGGNQSPNVISARRDALLRFAERNIVGAKFFIAEQAFGVLNSEKYSKNILDVENYLTDFSDFILIVLESPSAFAELGAFSHSKIRSKLIVINDSRFDGEQSFINIGPIQAIVEDSGAKRILKYKMMDNGIKTIDAIGSVFSGVSSLVQKSPSLRRTRKTLCQLNPFKGADINKKLSMLLVHDIVYLAGNASYAELVEICKMIFPDCDDYEMLRHYLSALVALGYVSHDHNQKKYKSSNSDFYYIYRFDMSKYLSAFRISYMENSHEQIFVPQR